MTRVPIHSLSVSTFLTLPWLFPWATGPSPAVFPYLFGWFCAALALLLSLSRRFSTEDGARVLAESVLAAGAVSVVLGLIQFFGLEKPLTPWIASSTKAESFANLRQRNQFATLTVMAWFACTYFFANLRPIIQSSKGLAWLGLAVFLGIGTAISASRTGVAEILMAGLVAGIWAWRSGVAAHLFASYGAICLGWLIGAVVLPWLRATGGDTLLERPGMGEEGCGSRLWLWQNVWQLTLEKPWAGWGWGNMKLAHYQGVFPPGQRFCDILDNAHNLPLHLAMELGLVVAGLLVLGTLWFLWRTWPDTLSQQHGFGAAHMACGMLCMVLLHSLLEYPLWYAPFQIACLICVVLLWVQRERSAKLITGDSRGFLTPYSRSVTAITANIASGLIALCAYAAWDYHRVSQIFLEPERRMEAYKTDTLEKIRNSILFADQVAFADLAIFPVTVENAAERLPLALKMLQQSPEPRVIENVLLGAYALGRKDLVQWHVPRYKTAFPSDFAAWAATPVGASILLGIAPGS